MQKKTIFITIESVKRELNSKILLSLKAINKKNFRVVIGQKGHVWSLFKDVNPGIALLKSFGPKNTEIINLLKKENFKIASNDEEIILAWDMEERLNYRMNNENLDKIDLLLAVGSDDYLVIKDKFNLISKNTKICGNLRLELLKKKYRSLLEKETKNYRDKYGDFILLTTQFGRINNYIKSKHEIDFVFSRIVENNVDPDSDHINIVNDQVIMQREILIQTLKFLNNFEKNFPNKKLLISPHPVENLNFWKNYIKKKEFKNIFLNEDVQSPTQALINSCSLIISSNSTTLLESYFLGKKRINFLSKKQGLAEISFLKEICKVVRSSDELNIAIKNLEEIDFNFSVEDASSRVKNLDSNFDAFENLLDLLQKLDGVKTYKEIFKNKKTNIYFVLINEYRKIKSLIKKIIGFKRNSLLEYLHKEKIGSHLEYNNFVNRVKHINEIENVNNLKIKQIIPQVFLLDNL